MFKRAVFVLVAVLLAAVFAGSALAASRSLPGAMSVTRVARPTGLIWGGGLAPPTRVTSQSSIGSRNFNNFFPVSYEDPVNHFDWSEFFGWVQPD